MATVTPNFNWPVPTSTDLVKDGATAIEALGDSIDASLVDLKGGTTGQVLSKTSNTDMDFTWVAQDDSNAIQNSIVDAKGDLIAASAADTPARLAVGTDGQVLTADSTAATGLAWATASAGSTNVAGKNGVLNSAFNVWQRGTSISFAASGSPYGPDRWNVFSGNTGTCSRQATGDTTNLPNIQYAARVQRTAGVTATTAFEFGQAFETINSIPFVGKTVTLSFYIRKGADFSGSTLNAQVLSGTGTDQNPISGSYTGQATVLNSNISASLTTTWQRITITGTVATSATELTVRFYWVPSGTAGAADYYEVTGVQLEIASSASAYSPNTSTYQAELAACQRYYSRVQAVTTGEFFAQGPANNSSGGLMYSSFPVRMRVAPTSIDYSLLFLQQYDSGGNYRTANVTSITLSNSGTQSANCNSTSASTSFSATGETMQLLSQAGLGYLGFNAEL